MKSNLIEEFKADADSIDRISAYAAGYAYAFDSYAKLMDELSEKASLLGNVFADMSKDAEKLATDFKLLIAILQRNNL